MSDKELLEFAEIYALGAPDGDELAEFQAHLPLAAPSCQRRVNEIREVVHIGAEVPLNS